jgi:rSAM/selenodomain-associated transferase 1
MSNKNRIIVFTRNPELGKVKTRLAKTLGDQSALEIYKHLLKHTEETIRELNYDKAIYYSENIHQNDIWNDTIYSKHLQKGTDLGERMFNAFQDAFNSQFEKVIIIGSDLLDLKPHHIHQAFEELETNDFVIGPAKDGGYYLLGMKQINPNIFKNKAWGTSSVLKNTLNDIEHFNVKLLEELNDIDTFEDMQHYQQLKPFYNL